MTRFIFWLSIYVLLLGSADINVRYSDGLHIKLFGWGNYWKRKKARAAQPQGEPNGDNP